MKRSLSARAVPAGPQGPGVLHPRVWMRGIFTSKIAREGGVVRRSLSDVERIVGLEAFCEEVRRRGFTAITDDRQIVIFCHHGRVRRLT